MKIKILSNYKMARFRMTGYSTWNDIMKNTKITDIQDPMLEMDISKCEFEEIYRDVIDELQGNDECEESYIDYYFTKNPTKSYVLSFKGDKERTAFYDIGLKKKSLLSLTEVCEGEEQSVKENRKKNDKKKKNKKTENENEKDKDNYNDNDKDNDKDNKYIIFC